MSFLRPDVLTLLGTLATLSGLAGVTAAAAAAPPTAGDRDTAGASAPDATASGPPKAPLVACTLTSAEKRERSAAIKRDLLPRVRTVTETANGYVLWFDRAEGELARIAGFVELESQCCAFLDFAIRLGSGNGRIALHLEGPEGTRELLRPLIEEGLAGRPPSGLSRLSR
jgi:hypothetical protein